MSGPRRHRFSLFDDRCSRCGMSMMERVDVSLPRCGRANRKTRKRRVRWWRRFARSVGIPASDIRAEERRRIRGEPTEIGAVVRRHHERQRTKESA